MKEQKLQFFLKTKTVLCLLETPAHMCSGEKGILKIYVKYSRFRIKTTKKAKLQGKKINGK